MIEYFPLIFSCYFLQVPSHALLYQLQQWPRSCFLPTTPLSYRGQRKCSSVNLTAATTTKASLLLPTDLIGGGCESYSTRSCFPPSVWHPTSDTGRRRCTTWWRCSLRKPTRETRWQWGFGWLLWLATSSPGCSSIRGECVCFVGGLVGSQAQSNSLPWSVVSTLWSFLSVKMLLQTRLPHPLCFLGLISSFSFLKFWFCF